MATTNNIYADSGINVELRIVAMRELTGYSERGQGSGPILEEAAMGRVPNLHNMRIQVRAVKDRSEDRRIGQGRTCVPRA